MAHFGVQIARHAGARVIGQNVDEAVSNVDVALDGVGGQITEWLVGPMRAPVRAAASVGLSESGHTRGKIILKPGT